VNKNSEAILAVGAIVAGGYLVYRLSSGVGKITDTAGAAVSDIVSPTAKQIGLTAADIAAVIDIPFKDIALANQYALTELGNLSETVGKLKDDFSSSLKTGTKQVVEGGTDLSNCLFFGKGCEKFFPIPKTPSVKDTKTPPYNQQLGSLLGLPQYGALSPYIKPSLQMSTKENPTISAAKIQKPIKQVVTPQSTKTSGQGLSSLITKVKQSSKKIK